MTLDDLLKQPAGPEVNEAVARDVMNWAEPFGYPRAFRDDTGRLRGLDTTSLDNFMPSTDGNAMLEVVEKLRAEGWDVTLQWLNDEKVVYATVEGDKGYYSADAPDLQIGLALCRAAIKACWKENQ
ncbi:MAG TPA: hypothetical protein VNA25_02840 [Phycisphaerae bacterium]|nr:hypothetical protein [Phycisphaerae bacterium]